MADAVTGPGSNRGNGVPSRLTCISLQEPEPIKITLHAFGRAFGTPDPSPFVTKAEVLLKMSGQPVERTEGDPRKAPKGKLPFIVDNGTVVADSTLIRWHLEAKYGVDFDKGLTSEQKGIA